MREESQVPASVVETLKRSSSLRLSAGDRWLIWQGDPATGWWEIYEKRRRQSVRLVKQTDDEAEAVRELLAGEGE